MKNRKKRPIAGFTRVSTTSGPRSGTSRGGNYSTACFLSQRGAEKILKSLLYYTGSRRQALLTHSLLEMTREAKKTVASLASLTAEARLLDLHYIPSRYPNGLPSGYPHAFYDKETAREALAAARRIAAAVEAEYRRRDEKEILNSDVEN
mgnify:CR=1 FL=1